MSVSEGTSPGEIAWVDGRLLPRAEATVSIDDFAVRYGATCFETMLARHGRVFRLDAHLDRLENGLRLLRAEPPARAALAAAIDATLEANGLRDASVRLAVSAGVGRAPDLRAASHPTITVTADAIGAPHPRSHLAIASVRLDARRPWRGAKVAQFLPYLLARAEAGEQGAEDALLLNHAGDLVEAATANVFLVLDGSLVTPSLECGPLPGVTRAAVIEVAAAAGIPVAETRVSLEELARASAVVLTSSVAGVVPMSSIRGVPPAVPGAFEWRLTPSVALPEQLRLAYLALVERECAG